MSAFNQETPDQNPASQDAFSDKLKEIKNEAGEQKYDSLDKAIEALKHSQEYIPELKSNLSQKDQEIENLKAELQKKAALEEIVEKLTAKQAEQTSDPQASGLDEQAVLNLVQGYSAEQEKAKALAQNEASVSEALFSQFGDKTPEIVAEKAKELGLSVNDLKDLSQRSPKAALNLFKVEVEQGAKFADSSVRLPLNKQEDYTLEPPEKSLLNGASTKDQVEYLRKVRENVYKKYDVKV